ncbi:MAG: septum formation initiator family protein [Bacteroidota bacterium]
MDKFRKLVGKYSLKLIQTKYTKYYMVLVLALVWMLFLDRFKLTSRYKVQQEIEQLRTERNYYEQSLKELEKRSYQMTQSEEIERLAREKYYMKKSDEDVFLIVEE